MIFRSIPLFLAVFFVTCSSERAKTSPARPPDPKAPAAKASPGESKLPTAPVTKPRTLVEDDDDPSTPDDPDDKTDDKAENTSPPATPAESTPSVKRIRPAAGKPTDDDAGPAISVKRGSGKTPGVERGHGDDSPRVVRGSGRDTGPMVVRGSGTIPGGTFKVYDAKVDTGNHTRSMADLGLALLPLIKEKGNVILSPFSLTTALGMVYLGATGSTQAQFESAGRFSSDGNYAHAAALALSKQLIKKNRTLTFRSVNVIQSGVKLLPAYVKEVKKWYAAPVKGLRKKGVVVLTNTTEFVGQWAQGFNKKNTKKVPFFLSSGKSLKVPTMHLSTKLPFYRGTGYQAVKMAYKGTGIVMYLVLPSKGTPVERTVRRLGTILDISGGQVGLSQKMSRITVDLALPRFTFKKKYELKPPLMAIGLTSPFSVTNAQFGNMNKGLYVLSVIQDAKIEVNERGTKAKAVTKVTMALRSAAPRPGIFHANRPFVFALVDDSTGALLFVGVVRNPLLKK